jgi:hypothetical protein
LPAVHWSLSSISLALSLALACSGERFLPSSEDSPGDAGATAVGGAAGELAGSASVPPPVPGTAHGGSSPGTGTAGVAGAAGGTDAEETAGAGGEALGGAGGSADSAVACPQVSAGDWELGFFPELQGETTGEVHPFFKITTRAALTPLDRIKVHYYFTRETINAETPSCYWVTGNNCSRAMLTFRDLPSPTPDATRVLEVTFPGASQVSVPSGDFEVRVGFKTGAPLLQTNDYSFDASAATPTSMTPFPYKRWSRVTLYVDEKLVWGAPPCPAGG